MYEHGAWSGMVRAFWILFYTRFQAKFGTGLDSWKWHSHWHSHWYTGKWPVYSGVFAHTLSTWIQGVSGFWPCLVQVVPFHQLAQTNNNHRPLLFTANLNWFPGSGGVLFHLHSLIISENMPSQIPKLHSLHLPTKDPFEGSRGYVNFWGMVPFVTFVTFLARNLQPLVLFNARRELQPSRLEGVPFVDCLGGSSGQ